MNEPISPEAAAAAEADRVANMIAELSVKRSSYHSPSRSEVRQQAIDAAVFVHVVPPVSPVSLPRRYRRIAASIMRCADARGLDAKALQKRHGKRLAQRLGGLEYLPLALDILEREAVIATFEPRQRVILHDLQKCKSYRRPKRAVAVETALPAGAAALRVQP